MYLCYIDESGTPEVPGTTSHYVLAGVSIPVMQWRALDNQIESIKAEYELQDAEIHVAWLLRKYLEQSPAHIPNFNNLSYDERRDRVQKLRIKEILSLQSGKNPKQLKQTKKNYAHSEAYMHLSYEERWNFVKRVALCLASWDDARLFAECIDKIHFNPRITQCSIDEQAFEQIVSRFEQYLDRRQKAAGLLIHDNNQTVALKHTRMMKKYHDNGTLWTRINNIVETPLFVDSQLTSMVQLADLCAYALRRYVENNETELFSIIFSRADRIGSNYVGVRHFTAPTCGCEICKAHRQIKP